MKLIKFLLALTVIVMVGAFYFFIECGYEADNELFYIDISYPVVFFMLELGLLGALLIGYGVLKDMERNNEAMEKFKEIS